MFSVFYLFSILFKLNSFLFVSEATSKAMVTKAISCDSILSDLEVSNYETMRMGQLEFAVNYNR